MRKKRKKGTRDFIWKLRLELKVALEQIDLSEYPLYEAAKKIIIKTLFVTISFCYTFSMNIANLISNVPKDELVDFLSDLATKNDSVASMLVARFAKADGNSELSAIKTEVNQIIRGNGDRHGFIDYRASYRFEKEMCFYMHNIFPSLISAGKNWIAFEALRFIFLKFAEPIDIDDSNGTIGNLTYEIMDFWKQAINSMTGDERRKARLWFEKNMHNEKIIDYMQEYLFSAYTDFFTDEESMRAQIKFIDSFLEETDSGSAHDIFSARCEVEQYAEARIHCMEKLNLPEDEILSFMEKYFEFDNICYIAVEKCLAVGNYEKAEGLLENLIVANQNLPGIVHKANEKLLDIYKATKNEAKITQTLRWLFLNERRFDLDLYKEYKSRFSKNEWADEREKLISEKENSDFAESIFVEERMDDRLFASVKKSHERWKDFYKLEEYSELLAKDYAAELVQMFNESLEDSVKNVNSRPQYAELAEHLENLSKIPSGKEVALAIRDEWLETYRKRPAMVDELKRARL